MGKKVAETKEKTMAGEISGGKSEQFRLGDDSMLKGAAFLVKHVVSGCKRSQNLKRRPNQKEPAADGEKISRG